MKFKISKNTEIIIEGKKILLEEGDTILLENQPEIGVEDLVEPEIDVLYHIEEIIQWFREQGDNSPVMKFRSWALRLKAAIQSFMRQEPKQESTPEPADVQ